MRREREENVYEPPSKRSTRVSWKLKQGYPAIEIPADVDVGNTRPPLYFNAKLMPDYEKYLLMQCAKYSIDVYNKGDPSVDYPVYWLYRFDGGLFGTSQLHEGFVTYDDQLKAIVICFKGTNPKKGGDLSADIKYWPVDVFSFNDAILPFHIDVARGFWQRFMQLNPFILGAIRAERKKHPDVHELICTGHSLGGAVATIAAVMYTIVPPPGIKRVRLVSIEAPRAFTEGTVRKLLEYPATRTLENMSYRVVNPNDIVPKLARRNTQPGPPEKRKDVPCHFGRPFGLIDQVNQGRFASHGSEKALQDLKNVFDPMPVADAPDQAFLFARGSLSQSRQQMKQKMAYVRSFRKKHH